MRLLGNCSSSSRCRYLISFNLKQRPCFSALSSHNLTDTPATMNAAAIWFPSST
ncbi:hypothetical protein BGZ61DRAFT_468017 [Ilyonectria robusta]|uniref:uncharacterized protein n=1 Tax=Ilyonectria robusta TaxID=1079257 RepID=UPI001E8EC9DA|nr:uncharacterized protein BGZ61DRAFT_468017 [Ilyonectria robusta]KAH8654186.1 hypothetical protein BGZ61DRAFT_468017 [Ilyonectria robusta]